MTPITPKTAFSQGKSMKVLKVSIEDKELLSLLSILDRRKGSVQTEKQSLTTACSKGLYKELIPCMWEKSSLSIISETMVVWVVIKQEDVDFYFIKNKKLNQPAYQKEPK